MSRLTDSPVKKGQVYAAPRWKGQRRVDQLSLVRGDSGLLIRVDFLDLRTSRTGWAYQDAFLKGSTLVSPAPALPTTP